MKKWITGSRIFLKIPSRFNKHLFAIAFDLVVQDVEKNHPKGVRQAYSDIASTLGNYGF